jgi:hypothetical protein
MMAKGELDVISDVLPLLDAIDDHTFKHLDHFGRDFVKLLNDLAVAAGAARIDDEGKESIGEGIRIHCNLKKARHEIYPFTVIVPGGNS